MRALEPEASSRYQRRALSARHEVPVESVTVSPIALGAYIGLAAGAVDDELPPGGGASSGCKLSGEVTAVGTFPPPATPVVVEVGAEEPPVGGGAGGGAFGDALLLLLLT